jgi:nucleotide-binding universal stress UspA family protein
MVGIDGSDTAMRAGAYAGGLARRQQAHLVVVFIAAPSAWTALVTPALGAAEEETFQQLTTEIRQQIRTGAEELGLSVTLLCRRGDPYVQLGRAADEVRPDMVVVGASGRGWQRRLRRSIAGRLVRAGRWPVVVVP